MDAFFIIYNKLLKKKLLKYIVMRFVCIADFVIDNNHFKCFKYESKTFDFDDVIYGITFCGMFNWRI